MLDAEDFCCITGIYFTFLQKYITTGTATSGMK